MPDSNTDDIPELPADQDSFDRAYVEKLRAEAAKYRTSLRPFEQAFGDFTDAERTYLFGLIRNLNHDPSAGAVGFRDMAKDILKEEFYTGLDDLPKTEQADPETEDKKEEDQVSLTPEQMQTILDERDAKSKSEAEEAATKAAEAAMVEEIYAEIEALGFERGSDGFTTALSLGASLAQQGKDVDFAALAPKVRLVLDLPEAETVADDAETVIETPAGSGNEFAKTATTTGAGGAGEVAKDWVAEAKAAGQDPMQVARERAEARLSIDA